MRIKAIKVSDKLTRKNVFEKAYKSYAKMQCNKIEWEKELEERALWDQTLLDSLEDE